jgi:hypothetical protein
VVKLAWLMFQPADHEIRFVKRDGIPFFLFVFGLSSPIKVPTGFVTQFSGEGISRSVPVCSEQ